MLEKFHQVLQTIKGYLKYIKCKHFIQCKKHHNLQHTKRECSGRACCLPKKGTIIFRKLIEKFKNENAKANFLFQSPITMVDFRSLSVLQYQQNKPFLTSFTILNVHEITEN